jgi:hypothetical protein
VPCFDNHYVSVSCFSTTYIIVRHLLRPLGAPVFYRDVILTLPALDDGSPEQVWKYDKVTRTTLQKLMDRGGCDVVQDPISKGWVDFELVDLHDNVLLKARSTSTPMDKRVRLITQR